MTQPAIQLSALVSFAHHLADVSAAAILPHFRRDLAVDEKGDGRKFDPVTEGDRAAESAIRAEISSHYPDHAILGEEHGNVAGTEPYRWVIDPIDGTRAFILGLPTWGTLIGLEIGDRPVIGMMNQPYTQDRLWTDGEASYFRGAGNTTRQIRTRPTVDLANAQLASTHPGLFDAGVEASSFEAICGKVKASRFGTDCFAYAMLAAGLIDLVVEAGLQAYDIIALIPIIENAGGVVSSWDGGEARHGGRIVAAANPSLHAEALQVLGAA